MHTYNGLTTPADWRCRECGQSRAAHALQAGQTIEGVVIAPDRLSCPVGASAFERERHDFVAMLRIRNEARAGGYPEPSWEADGFTTAIFRPNPDVRAAAAPSGTKSTAGTAPDAAHDVAHDAAHDTAHDLTSVERGMLAACAHAPRSTPELLQKLGHQSRTRSFKNALTRLLTRGLLEMTIPQKPRSKNQRYRITEEGLLLIAPRKR